MPSGRAKDQVDDLSPTPEQLEEALNHIWDLSVKYKGKFDIHVHCPHFARVVKQRNIPNFDEWYAKEFHGKCTYFAFGGYISIIENGNLIPCFYTDLRPMEPMKLGNIRDPKSLNRGLGRNESFTLLQQLPRQTKSQRQMQRLRIPRHLRRMQKPSLRINRRHLRSRRRMRIHPRKTAQKINPFFRVNL